MADPTDQRRARFWRLGRLWGGYSPTTNGAGENAGWTFYVLHTRRWEVSIHRTSKAQAAWNERPRTEWSTEECPEHGDHCRGTDCCCADLHTPDEPEPAEDEYA